MGMSDEAIKDITEDLDKAAKGEGEEDGAV